MSFILKLWKKLGRWQKKHLILNAVILIPICSAATITKALVDMVPCLQIRVITKLPNSEQSYKGKVKTHKYISRQNQSITENCENRNDTDLVQAFLKKWWVESDLKALNLPLSLRLKGSGCHYNSMYNNTGTK